MFASLLKAHGPMDSNDSVLQSELEKCSTEAQIVICEAGGVCKFLRQSLQFAVADSYVCLASDVGKAQRLARSRRQALLQQPQVKLNPPPSMTLSASAATILPNTTPSTLAATKTSVSAYHSVAGMELPSSSRVIAGLSQQTVSELSNVPAFLSQPSAAHRMFQPDTSSSALLKTAVLGGNNYNDNGIKKVNSDNTWMTVCNVSKSSNLDISTSGTIGELDDFSEPFTSESSSNAGKLTLNEDTVTTKDDQLKQQEYYNINQVKNLLDSSESDSSDESSAAGSVDLSSSSGSVADEEDFQGDGSEKIMPGSQPSSHPIGSLDSFDTEGAESCTPQLSMSLSVTAPEFIPQTFVANRRTLIPSLGKSTSSRASSHSRPSSRAAMMSNKRVQTDDSWASEIQQLNDSHAMELAEFHQQLSHARAQLQVSLTVLSLSL